MKKIFILLIIVINYVGLYAQSETKFEYGSIVLTANTYSPKKYLLTINILNESKTIEGKLQEGTIVENHTPITNASNELSIDGWEVYSTNYVIVTPTIILNYNIRRHKKD